MKLKTLIATAALALASASSHAGVIYEWVTVSNNMPVNINGLRIEFDGGAVSRGSASLAIPAGSFSNADSGLISIIYMGSAIKPSMWNPPISSAAYVFMDVQFVDNNFFMTGSIQAQGLDNRLHAGSGNSRLWTIGQTRGDAMLDCDSQPGGFCSGTTGFFRQVPEPTSVALLGLGLAGALAARRRKRKA